MSTLLWAQQQWSDARSYAIDRREDLQVASSSQLDIPLGSFSDLCLRCDGAFKKGAVAIGVILQGSSTLIMDGVVKKIPAVSSLFSEAVAIREACLVAIAADLREATVVSDSLEMIKLSSNEDDPLWEIGAFVCDIRYFANALNLRFLHKLGL